MLPYTSFRRPLRRLYCLLTFLLFFLGLVSIFYKQWLSPTVRVEINPIQNVNLIQTNQTGSPVHPRNTQVTKIHQTPPDKCNIRCPYSSALANRTLEFSSSHIIRHFPSFVCPQNFRNLADWIYQWPSQFKERVQTTTDNGTQIAPCLPPGSIIYVRQWAVDSFFKNIYPHLKNQFVLVTGEGDTSSPTHLEILDAPDSKIIHWFGQNGQYHPSKTKKFTHLPIGINCYEMADGIQNVYSQIINQTRLPSVFNDFDETNGYVQPQDVSYRALTSDIPKDHLVLINFDPGNDGSGLRSRLVKEMCSDANNHSSSFVKCISKPGGVQIDKLSEIYARNRQYPFWLSPRGGGWDCHRTWEALYLDIIPIVWNNSLSILYEDLPILVINDHSELNEQFLYEKLKEISKKKLSKEKVYKYEKLRHAYWRRLILEKSRHKDKDDIYQRKNLCWTAKSTVPLRRS